MEFDDIAHNLASTILYNDIEVCCVIERDVFFFVITAVKHPAIFDCKLLFRWRGNKLRSSDMYRQTWYCIRQIEDLATVHFVKVGCGSDENWFTIG